MTAILLVQLVILRCIICLGEDNTLLSSVLIKEVIVGSTTGCCMDVVVMMMRQFFRGNLSLSLDVPSLVSFLFFWIGYKGILRFLAVFHGFLEKKDDLSTKFTKFAMYRFCSVASFKK